MATRSLVAENAFEFAVKIVMTARQIQQTHREFVLSRQVLRSGTSIGANIEEALAGQSRRDFIAKLSIASKEARETAYWVKLMAATKFLDQPVSTQLTRDCDQLCCMLTSIVKTTREN